jgi:hypothetical protein
MQTYRLYIGANNTTGTVEREKAMAIVSAYYEAFSLFDGVGYWRGEEEKNLIIEIATEDKAGVIEMLCRELKQALNQQAIGLLKIESGMSFI